MKIIHFSDSHVGGPAEDWLAYIDKRWVGVFNYCFRRKFQHDQSLLTKTVKYIIENKPDLAICTGDITSTSQPSEFKHAMELLEPLHQSNVPLLYLPGNHDYYVRTRKCVQSMKDAFSYLNTAIDITFDELPLKFNMFGLEFLLVNESWPTSLLSSCGYLTRKTSDFLCANCAEKGQKARILIGHFPLIEDHPVLRIRHRLWGQKDALRLLREKKIDLSLCGHMHLPYSKLDKEGRGEICAGSVTRNSCFAVIEYREDENIFAYEKKLLPSENH